MAIHIDDLKANFNENICKKYVGIEDKIYEKSA